MILTLQKISNEIKTKRERKKETLKISKSNNIRVRIEIYIE